jgi:hypothetical protein
MSEAIQVLQPTPPRAARRAQERRSLGSLAGKTVGFIDNAKPNFNHLVDDLAELLVGQYGAAGVIKHRKPGQVPVAAGALAELVERCDAVIAGSGD